MRDFLETLAEDQEKTPEQRARELSRRELPKRFYKTVEPSEEAGKYVIKLDGRTVKTPARSQLELPNLDLAQTVAGEWAAQEKVIDPGTMPLTRIASTAIDAVTERFAEVADDITRYAGNDALCYRADKPRELVDRQTDLLDPPLNWAGELLGGRFVLAGGILHVEQPEELLSAFRAALDALTPLELAAFHTVTTLTGSAVLALVLSRRHMSADEVWKAAYTEEDWTIEHWGEDAEEQRIRAFKRTEFDAAALVLV